MKIGDIMVNAAYLGSKVLTAIAVGATKVWEGVSKYIKFKDPVVEQLCMKWSSDGIGITPEDAAKVTDIGTTFRGNTEITSFDELDRFGVKGLNNTQGSFYGCTSLESVNLVNIETIVDNSFNNCTSLKSPIIAPKLKQIGTYLVFANSQIEEVLDLGEITSIGGLSYSIFKGCSKLKKVVLPPTCRTLGKVAFSSLSALEEINLEHIESIGQDALINLTSLSIPLRNNHLTKLNSCTGSGFTECDCPNVETIDGYTFYNCPNLSGDINFPKLKTIGASAFGNTKIKSIVNLGNVEEISDKAFQNIKTITSAVIPRTIKKLGAHAFSGCANMMIEELYLPNLISLGDSAFKECDIRKVSSLGSAPLITTFSGNKNLKSINLHEGVLELGYGVFYGCASLGPSIELPSTLTKIGGNTFAGCTSLVTIICKASTPPTVDALGLTSATKEIYVPYESVEAYKAATNWSAYADRIKSIEEYVEPTTE